MGGGAKILRDCSFITISFQRSILEITKETHNFYESSASFADNTHHYQPKLITCQSHKVSSI